MISHWDDVRTWRGERDHIAGTWSSLTGRVSQSVGVKRIQVDPGTWSTPLHLEGAEEEIFYVREARASRCSGRARATRSHTRSARGDARPAGTGVAHAFRGGDDGMTLLMYGTREPNDMCFHPRSGKVLFGGLGLVTRVGEGLDHWEGED